MEAGYWLIRANLNHVSVDALIKGVAARFGFALPKKALAQVVPIVGLLAGGGLNYAFIDHYQRMARVHFAIRDIERRSGDPPAVRACFGERGRGARRERKPHEPE